LIPLTVQSGRTLPVAAEHTLKLFASKGGNLSPKIFKRPE
jgi:hypothetical protein